MNIYISVCFFARVDPNQTLLFQCTIQEAKIIWRELHITFADNEYVPRKFLREMCIAFG